VRRIGKVLIAHEDTSTCGFGAELAAQISEHAFVDLDAPVMRVTMADTPSPTHKALFDAVMPTTARITTALRDLVRW
jgi:2-oxoisovalerate dehydrogenase E1 component